MSNPYRPPEDSHHSDPVGGVESSGTEIIAPLFLRRGWMKFLGVMLIISGVLGCLTIIGIIWGWAPIVVGARLLGAARALEDGYPAGDASTLLHGMKELASAVKIYGIFLIIMTGLTLLYMMAGFLVPLLLISG